MNLLNKKNKKKVICALSGGVDSSVAAALLKKQGYFVVGVFMKFWSDTKISFNGEKPENRCCSGDAYEAAKNVCTKLNIPFRVLNIQQEFKKRVVDYFLSEYKVGRTPNPCVRCNKEIKFKILLEIAKKWGIDYVATGHYARLRQESSISGIRPPIFYLLTAKDKKKDQSYFLYNLTQEQLRHILFPIGEYTKEEIRKMAKKWNLPSAQKKESFEVCFVPDKHIANFLARYIKVKPGKIINEKGQEIGIHQGVAFYTIGQRHGLKIFKGKGPFYVAAKDLKKNKLIVVNNPNSSLLWQRDLIAKKVNWILGKPPKFPFECRAKIRYRQPAKSCIINQFNSQNFKSNTIKVSFNKPQKAITPGQSIVFYRGYEVLGGGIIT